MPFAPRDFFTIAQTVVSDYPDSEAALRTGVGRAYYATFLEAREKLRIRVQTGKVHQAVIGALKKADRFAGDQLDKLEELRGIADYDLNVRDPLRSNWSDNWTVAESYAIYVLRRIERIP